MLISHVSNTSTLLAIHSDGGSVKTKPSPRPQTPPPALTFTQASASALCCRHSGHIPCIPVKCGYTVFALHRSAVVPSELKWLLLLCCCNPKPPEDFLSVCVSMLLSFLSLFPQSFSRPLCRPCFLWVFFVFPEGWFSLLHSVLVLTAISVSCMASSLLV